MNALLYECRPLSLYSFFPLSRRVWGPTARKTKPYDGHFALRVLAESLKLFLCADNATQKWPIKGRVTLGDCGLRLEWIGQWSRDGVDDNVSGLV